MSQHLSWVLNIALLALTGTVICYPLQAMGCFSHTPIESPLFQAMPPERIDAPYALEVEIVSTAATTWRTVPPPPGGYRWQNILDRRVWLATTKVKRILWGELDASTVHVLYGLTSCPERVEIGATGFIFGHVRHGTNGEAFFGPSKRAVWNGNRN